MTRAFAVIVAIATTCCAGGVLLLGWSQVASLWPAMSAHERIAFCLIGAVLACFWTIGIMASVSIWRASDKERP